MRKLLLASLIALSLTPALWASEAALTPEQERRAVSLYGEFKCPVCKSQSVAASTSFLSEEMKRQIRELLAAGRSDQEIKDHFVARYGEWVLLRPKTSGRGLWAWIVPGVVLTAALAWLGWQLHRWSAASSPATSPSQATGANDGDLSLEQRQKIQALIEG